MLAQIAEREPAPLEGIAADAAPARGARGARPTACSAISTGCRPRRPRSRCSSSRRRCRRVAERRELGRRVLTRLREADRDTFVRLLDRARASLAEGASRAKACARALEVVLSAPLTAPGAIGELALGLLAQPSLAQSWIEVPATRLAAGAAARGADPRARCARGGAPATTAAIAVASQVLARPGVRAALAPAARRSRGAGLAVRGHRARACSRTSTASSPTTSIASCATTATNTELRRAAASAAAALERGGAAQRWAPLLVERAAKEPGVARGTILGLAGLAIASRRGVPTRSRAQLVAARAARGGRGARRAAPRGGGAAPCRARPRAALAWTRAQMRGESRTEATTAAGRCSTRSRRELGGDPRADGIGVPIAAARAALDAGDVPTALREARAAVEEIAAAADWLARRDRRRSDRSPPLDAPACASSIASCSPTTRSPPCSRSRPTPIRCARQFARALASDRERAARARDASRRPAASRTAACASRGCARSSACSTACARPATRPRPAPRRRAPADGSAPPHDQSSLRRAVWAALTRAGDALLRDGHAELTDFLLAWTTAFPDEDFAIVREASMVPEIEAAFEAYARLHQATWAAADPDDTDAMRTVVERLAELADALPPEQSPRVESVRLALARARQPARAASPRRRAATPCPAGTLDAIATELGTLARRVFGARQRLGLPAEDRADELETAVRAIDVSRSRSRSGTRSTRPSRSRSITRAPALPPAIAAAIERVLVLARAPPAHRARPRRPTPLEAMLPAGCRCRACSAASTSCARSAAAPAARCCSRCAPTSARAPIASWSRSRSPTTPATPRATSPSRSSSALFREEAGALLALPAHAEPRAVHHVRCERAAQARPRHGVRPRHEPRAHARRPAT